MYLMNHFLNISGLSDTGHHHALIYNSFWLSHLAPGLHRHVLIEILLKFWLLKVHHKYLVKSNFIYILNSNFYLSFCLSHKSTFQVSVSTLLYLSSESLDVLLPWSETHIPISLPTIFLCGNCSFSVYSSVKYPFLWETIPALQRHC